MTDCVAELLPSVCLISVVTWLVVQCVTYRSKAAVRQRIDDLIVAAAAEQLKKQRDPTADAE